MLLAYATIEHKVSIQIVRHETVEKGRRDVSDHKFALRGCGADGHHSDRSAAKGRDPGVWAWVPDRASVQVHPIHARVLAGLGHHLLDDRA